MAVYTHLTNEEIAQIVESYDIGALRFAVGIAEGVENSNYLIETEQGDASSKYILTLYEKRVNENDLPFFIELMHHLSAQGFPSPKPIVNRDGQIIFNVKDRSAAMVSFLSGRSCTLVRNPHVSSLGGMIAKLHLDAADCSLTRANDLSLEGWKEIYERIKGQLDSLQPGLSKVIGDELAWLEADWPKDLPAGIIHADLFPDNVFFEGSDVSGIIDFYFASKDIYAYELAICLNCWCFEASGEFNLTKSQRLLQSYQKVRALSDDEKQAMPTLARGAAMRFFLTRAHDKLFHDANAIVTPKDPMEYLHKLQFHQRVQSIAEYGLL